MRRAIPLRVHRVDLAALWFWAAYLVTTHTPGFSALQLQRQLGLNRYETAWTMLHKLRRAMVRPERDRLAGSVEVDETYVAGIEEGRRGGRQRDSNKSIVVGAVEVRGRGSGRVRLAVVEDLSAEALVPFVHASVAPGSRVLTDGWRGYAPLRHQYDHQPTTVGDPKNASKQFPDASSTHGGTGPQRARQAVLALGTKRLAGVSASEEGGVDRPDRRGNSPTPC